MAAVLLLLLAAAHTSSATSLQDCDADMTGFELVTGYVFTAPDDLLDSIPGTLMLTDCLEACHANDTCFSVNYETGLCVMFSSNADAYPGNYVYPFWYDQHEFGRGTYRNMGNRQYTQANIVR